jgi:hypothetical protein
MDCECIIVTVVPDDRYKGAEQTEQVESKETTKSNITSTRVFQAEGKRRCWKQSFFDERQGLWEGKKQMQSGSSAERRTSSVE